MRREVHRVASVGLAVALAAITVAWPDDARACSCRVPPLREALVVSEVVAEVRLLEVGPADPDDDMGVQMLRLRLERIFEAPAGLTDGMELWVPYQRCNSTELRPDQVGSRWVQFFGGRRGALVTGYCTRTLSAWAPLPSALLEERERWLRRPR